MLESHPCLTFLITNRISTIDSSLRGRIDLILPYFDLGEDSRKSIWKNIINRLSPGVAEVSQDDFDILAKDEMNGREIKNSIEFAMVLAEHKGEPLKLEHLRVVLDIRKRVSTFELLDKERNAADDARGASNPQIIGELLRELLYVIEASTSRVR
jgi:hypothetical protein